MPKGSARPPEQLPAEAEDRHPAAGDQEHWTRGVSLGTRAVGALMTMALLTGPAALGRVVVDEFSSSSGPVVAATSQDADRTARMAAANETATQWVPAWLSADRSSPEVVSAYWAEVIVPGVWDGLSIAPAVEGPLASVRDELVGVRVGRESRLRQALAAADYDLVLLDCPPELGLLTINGLVAADAVVIVTGSRLLSVQGVAGVMETISTVRAHYNPDLIHAGVIVNAHEARTLTGQARLEELRQSVDVLEPPIPKRAAINDSAEAAVGLDAWPDDGPHLATLYSDLLDTITERTPSR